MLHIYNSALWLMDFNLSWNLDTHNISHITTANAYLVRQKLKKKIQIFYSTFCWKCINMSSKSPITEKTNYSKKVVKNHSSY